MIFPSVPARKKPPESNSAVTARVNTAGSFFYLDTASPIFQLQEL